MKPLQVEDNPMLSINVRLWKFLSVVFARNWRVYWFVVPVCCMNAMQFVNLFRMWGDLTPFILNTFFTAAIFDALLRTCLVIINRRKFEAFMLELTSLYEDIEASDDEYAKSILRQKTLAARKISIFNLTASFCDIIGALVYPLFSEDRLHPFGVALPGVDVTASPIYEILYILQFPTPLVLTAMYMPFVSLFASFAMFGTATLVVLRRRLQQVCDCKDEHTMFEEFKRCMMYHARIARFVRELNDLVTYIVCVEFLLFGAIICSLLFCMNLIDSSTQIISVIMYIFTMLYVLFTYYWQANELYIESLRMSEAIYEMQWYSRNLRFQKAVLMFMARTQQPLKIMVGNVYPMTLVTFQSLLNASYSYFTMLRGVYHK